MNATRDCAEDYPQRYYNTPLLVIEKAFDYTLSNERMKQYWPISLVIITAYLALIKIGQRYMIDRKPYNLRSVLFGWNLFLSLFSIFACYRVVPEMVYMTRDYGFASVLCDYGTTEHRETIGVWVFLFAHSKVLELGDTAFIVLRKQRLIFLHWYHHISVLLFVWYTTAHLAAMCYPFMTLNYVVHSFMYSYYTLKALKVKVPRKVSMAVTAMQLLQMVGGISITTFVYWSQVSGKSCCATPQAIYAAMIMYGSYFVLFLKFFVDVYWRKISIENYSSKKIN